MSQLIEQLKESYHHLDVASIPKLRSCYDDNVFFIDPVNEIAGLDALLSHFQSLYENLIYCRFHFHDEAQCIVDSECFLQWTMEFQHARLNRAKTISVTGISHLKFNKRVYYHKDWYDLGAMVYEHVPVVGGVIKLIKKKQASKKTRENNTKRQGSGNE